MKKITFLVLLALLPLCVAGYTLGRVSVHDPSVVWEPNSHTYYIFGSFREVAKTTDMMNWTRVASGTDPSGEVGVPWKAGSNDNAASGDAFSTPAVTKVTVGSVEKDMPAFDAKAWSANGGTQGKAAYDITGNLWAPDVIFNTAMNKWCMYMSVNGDNWYSSIVLLTADNIVGPYTYQAPVVISGFTSANYKLTDLELAIGEQSSLPTRYNSPWASTSKSSLPNNIDPCVFYDQSGKLWMSYGSWSGGIFMLELDENTGLRDYNVSYPVSATSDPYFGKKIAGGYYSSGEASYIEYIGGYYYLFVSYGGLQAGGVANDINNGGYQMRVFRSTNPDGPYLDPYSGSSAGAIYGDYRLNFGANATSRGENIFGAYGDWGYQARGVYSERAQGHNSIIAAGDGRTYLVYHTRFQNRGEGHEVRVHQVFQNEDGWLVAAPFEYTGETVTSAQIASTQQIATADIPGHYKLLVHRDRLDHTKKEMVTPVEIELRSDGTIIGAYTGTWTNTANKSYVQITLNGTTYKGVMVEQTMEPTTEKVIAFTAMSNSNGINIWGHKFTPDEPVAEGTYDITTGIKAYYNFDAVPITNYYNDSQTATLQKEASNSLPELQTDSERSGKVIHTKFGALEETSNAKFVNPLYNENLPDGATIAFWVNPVDENHWDALFGFYKSDLGRLYMTGNNYIGYNSGGWIDLNHPNSVTANDIVFGCWNFVTVTFSRTDGVKVYVNGVYKPFQVTANDDASLDYNEKMVNFISMCPDFYFGYGSWWGSANALYDELLFYNRVLTATDAKALYQKELTDNVYPEITVPKPVYFNSFASNSELTIVGSGEFVADADPNFGMVYQNDPKVTKAVRTNYLLLPGSVLTHSGTTKEMTIGFWVNAKNAADFWSSPIFTAYIDNTKAGSAQSWPMFAALAGGTIQSNCQGWCDYTDQQNDKGANAYDTFWMDDKAWHYYTITLTTTKAAVYIDGKVKNSWTVSGGEGQNIEGVFTGGANNQLAYVCLGGNQPWGQNIIDPAFAFDDFAVYDVALTAEQIGKIIAAKTATSPYEIVGAKDCSTNYLGASSSGYTLKKGDTKVFTFRNHSNKGKNWENWLICVKEGTTDKAITRADFFDVIYNKHLDADGNDSSEDWALMSTDGGTTKKALDWSSFTEDMADAHVVATVTYGTDGTLAIHAESTGEKSGNIYYVDNVGHVAGLTGNLTVTLSVDHSWLEVVSVEQTTVGVTTTAAGRGFATLYTDKALDFSGATGLTAYTATCDGTGVTLTAVSDIPAGTGVVLRSDNTDRDITYSIPVADGSQTDKGELLGSVTEATEYNAFEGYDLYMLAQNGNNEAQFTKVTSGSIAAGKAYLMISSSTGTRNFSVSFGDGSTPVFAIEGTEGGNDRFYNLAGQRVTMPKKGLYIVRPAGGRLQGEKSKKVIIK